MYVGFMQSNSGPEMAGHSELPPGWGVLELAESEAREALARWDSPASPGLYLDRGIALANAMRKLLAELEAERRFKAQG
jgi:hypothetical protein